MSARLDAEDRDPIDWTDYYPPGARVPRINPESIK